MAVLPPETFRTEGAAAVALLQTLPLWQHYRTILIFLSIKYEIDTLPLLEAALAGGKFVFAPKIKGESLRFLRVFSPAGPWERSPFGIREPAGTGPALGPADFPALIVTPGLGFDRRGGRLGHGGGYYDRFFAELNAPRQGGPLSCYALGFCTAAQLVDEVPMEALDRRMDAVIAGAQIAESPPMIQPWAAI